MRTKLEWRSRDINEALLVSSVHQHELTEQAKKAEAAMAETCHRFREMVDVLPMAIYTTDHEGRLTHFNPAAVEFAGRTPELGTDRWCVSWKLYHPVGTPSAHDECLMATAPGKVAQSEAEKPSSSVPTAPDAGLRLIRLPFAMLKASSTPALIP